MKFLLILSALVIFAIAAPSEDEKLLDNFDLEAFFTNDEQRKPLFDCLLDLKPCGDLQQIKDKVIRVFKSKCAKCTPEQKQKYDHVIQLVQEKYNDEFKNFMKKIANNNE